jgi:hypothetical protein
MRKFANYLKCALGGRNYKSYYAGLEREQLLRAKQNLWKHTIIPALCWAAAILIVAWSKPDQPEISMLFITLGGYFIVTQIAETKGRRRLIEQELDQRF